MTDLSTILAPNSRATIACPVAGSCHFPQLADPTASDRVLQKVYCAAEWSQCSVFSVLVHGHEVSSCLWPDGEVKVVEKSAVEGDGSPVNRPG